MYNNNVLIVTTLQQVTLELVIYTNQQIYLITATDDHLNVSSDPTIYINNINVHI